MPVCFNLLWLCESLDSVLPTSRWITDMSMVRCKPRYLLLFFADCLALLNYRVSLRDVLHPSFNASLQVCSEEAVQFPVWKFINLLRDQNRLRFLVSFYLFLVAFLAPYRFAICSFNTKVEPYKGCLHVLNFLLKPLVLF